MISTNSIKILTVISAAALLLFIVFINTASAGTYIKGSVGANWNDVQDPLDSDTGTVVGVAVGMDLKAVPGMRVELEVAQRSNEVDVLGFVNADHTTTSVMANAIYDINADIGPARPYVLVGAGMASTKAVIENLSIASLENTGFAWQLGAGFTAKLADGVKADLGYRYFQGPEIEVLGFEASDGSNHAVMLGVSFDLN